MSFPKYEKYKDSGVEWLGEVPKYWKVISLKRAIVQIESGTSVNASDTPVEQGSYGVLKTSCVYQGWFDWRENKAVLDNEINRVSCPLRQDTLIVSRMNTPELVGAAGIVTEAPEGIFLPDRLWQVSFEQQHSASFIYYFTRSRSYRAQVKISCYGASSSMQNLGQDDFKSVSFAAPPGKEQTQIARFLDHETARIDALISEQQRLIALLKEKRQAVISHAVTKGLDPTVPMKDSGVEWLGEVPEHWEVAKFKWLLQTASGGTPSTSNRSAYYDGDIPWLRSLDLNNDLVTDYEIDITQRAVNETSCKMVSKGSVLIAMYGGGGTIGKNGLLMFDSAINQAICAFLPSSVFNPSYLHRYIQFYRPYWMVGAESSRKDPNIGQDRIGDHSVLRPPFQEQNQISKFLEEELFKFRQLSIEANILVNQLQERRSALISAAVTGKIDVRGWQPPASESPIVQPAPLLEAAHGR